MRHSDRLAAMRTLRLSPVLVSALAVLALGATPDAAKDATGVYALIDRIIFEPDATNPARVQLWGVFRVADTFAMENGQLSRIDLNAFRPVERGYMYFAINPTDPAATRAEWTAMASYAGTGQPIAFGARIPPDAEPALAGSGRVGASILEDTARIGSMIRYNGRVRAANEVVGFPDAFPLRMTGFAPPMAASRSLPAVRVLLRGAAEPAR